jgi:NADH:ubiquinone reductase (H+-translocating)
VASDVVIVGGGFGGLYAARRLERRLPRHSARILLVTDVNFLLYTPLLPGAAAGSLEPRHVVVPLREELDWTDIRLGRVTGADPDAGEVHIHTVDERDETLRYDQLILTPGSVSRVLAVPGLADHALGFKTLADAIALRNRLLINLEIAESLPHDEARREYLTVVFVGAGYAGLEGIAELQDYAADVIDRYPRCRLAGTRFVLVEAQERVMQEIPAPLAEFATKELRGRGMEIRTGTMLKEMDERSATLSTGERIPTRMLCWTAGVRPAPVVGRLGLPLNDQGRIEVDATMKVAGRDNVWAIGDAAAVPDPARGHRTASPPTCQHAIRQGRRVAENVAATLRGHGPRPFRYRTLGVFVDMGQHKAVATVLGVRLRGLPAWFAARTYHLMMMPGVARKLRLGLDWGVGLFFGRATAELGQLAHPAGLGEPGGDS